MKSQEVLRRKTENNPEEGEKKMEVKKWRGHNKDRLDGSMKGRNLFVVLKCRTQ